MTTHISTRIPARRAGAATSWPCTFAATPVATTVPRVVDDEQEARRMGERDDEPALHLGGVLVELHLPGVSSLKEKRALVRPVIAALEQELGASVAEVGWQDRWQRAALGVALAASSASQLDRAIERVIALSERDPRVLVTRLVDSIDVVRGDDA